jgi:D-cysteine desulfhydrase
LFIKRDDQTGLATGGNKTRKLEFLVGDAMAKGRDTLVTGGAMQSNHCRQTAAAAAACGLECHLVLGGETPSEPSGNVLLDLLMGATIHWCGERSKGEDIPHIADMLRAAGRRPYVVPYGGSNPIGAAGFIAALAELKEQAETAGVRFTHIVFASSSGGTQAGLVVGNELLGLGAEILGIGIDKWEGEPKGFAARVRDLCNDLAVLVQLDHSFSPAEVRLDQRFTGQGYGVVGDLEREAIRLVAASEGILLDPVYTGRAFGAMLELIREGTLTEQDTVLFWHTGGIPALFAYARDLVVTPG